MDPTHTASNQPQPDTSISSVTKSPVHPPCRSGELVSAWGSVMMNNYGTPSLGLISGNGARVVAEDGAEYVDMLAGIAVSSLGYAHPGVVKAVSEQIGRLGHSSNLFATQPAVTLAGRIIDRVARGRQDIAESTRVLFCNSGAEANEAAFKLARLTGRSRILAAVNGFHGRTMGALAMTGQPGKRDIFAPLPGGVEFFPYGDVEYLSKLVGVNPKDTAAIIVEPIQGETGVVPAPEGFLAAIRALCDDHGIVMIVDEVQTGVGRTGLFFAHEYDNVTPDIVTMAKGLGAGLPIGACVATGTAASLFGPGSHGTTFGGNPVACAAGTVVLDVIDDDFLARVRQLGHTLATKISGISGVKHVRGRGLMLGVVLDAPVAKKVVAAGLDTGVIVNAPNESVVRLTPPLVLTEDDIDIAVERFAAALQIATTTS